MQVSEEIVAVDPGLGGGYAHLKQGGGIDLHSYLSESIFIEFLLENPNITKAVIEDVPTFVSNKTSNSSSFKLGYNFGFEVGAVRTRGISLDLVKPKIWQKGIKGLKPGMGYTQRKRLLADAAKRKYPDLKVTQKNADALLILDYYIN